MRSLLVVMLLAAPVVADPKVEKTELKPAKPAPCKKVIVNKKAVCEITAPIVVGTAAPKPGVVYVTTDGKKVTGRPKSEDRLKGMGPQTK